MIVVQMIALRFRDLWRIHPYLMIKEV